MGFYTRRKWVGALMVGHAACYVGMAWAGLALLWGGEWVVGVLSLGTVLGWGVVGLGEARAVRRVSTRVESEGRVLP